MALSFASSAQDEGSLYEPLKQPKGTIPFNPSQQTLDLPAVGVRAAPTNNNFASATVIDSLNYNTVYTASSFEQATIEGGEAAKESTCADDPSLHSVWYTYTPAQNVAVNVDLTGSNFDTILTVYRGTTLGGLTQVACNDDYIDLPSALVSLSLNASTKYYFRISEFRKEQALSAGSTSKLRIYQTPPKINVTVNTTNDTFDINPGDGKCIDSNGQCSLRAAIIEANFLSSGTQGSIITVPAGTYALTRATGTFAEDTAYDGDLDILVRMGIQGVGAGATVINANKLDSVFQIRNGAAVSLSGMTLTNGDRTQGGGILLQQTEDGVISTLVINGVDITGNTSFIGGGISVQGANLTAINSTIRNNTSSLLDGGGIDSGQFNNVITLKNVTIAENTATASSGGGVYVGSTTNLTANNVTFISNVSKKGGGGISVDAGGKATLKNTLVVKNTSNDTNQEDCAGTITSQGYNMFQVSAGCNGLAGTDRVEAVVGVENIAFNDPAPGLKTAALKTTSPALNAGNGCETTDQRSVTRPQGNVCDIGAYELVTDLPVAVTLKAPANNQSFETSAGINLVWSSARLAFSYKVDVIRVSGASPATVLSKNYPVNNINCDLNNCTVPLNLPSLPVGIYTFSVSASNNNGTVPARNNPTTFVIGTPVEDVIVNSGFEITDGATPVGWNLKNKTKDKIKCNKLKDDGTYKLFSYGGECAFMFLGGADERAKLKQRPYKLGAPEGNIDLSPYNLGTGSQVTLSMFYKATSTAANGKTLVKVKYINGEVEKKVMRFNTTADYTALNGTITLPQPMSNIDRIVVVLLNRSTAKKILVDNVSLYLPLNTTALRDDDVANETRSELVPLPELPTFRD